MTIFNAPLPPGKPKYQALAERISAAIRSGDLHPGQRLPPQRELAQRLGITVGTVTRAYEQISRRGMISAEVGKGSFVLAPKSNMAGIVPLDHPAGIYDLSINFPASSGDDLARELLNEALEDIRQDEDAHRLLRHHPHEGAAEHRAAGAELLSETGLDATPDDVLICAGTQHALLILLMTLLRPGDAIAAEELTYPGLKSLAASLGIRIHGVEIDECGIIPEKLDAVLARSRIAALYTIPTLQNPTASTMPLQRRREVVEIARAKGVPIIEDNIYGLIPENAPPALANLDDTNVFHILGISKGIAPGLRIAYLRSPANYVSMLAAAIRNTVWVVPPLMAEIAQIWIRSGKHRKILAAKRETIHRRLNIARQHLGGPLTTIPDASLHCWLKMPHGGSSEQLAHTVRRHNVIISPASDFATVSRITQDGIRICLHAVQTDQELEHGLRILVQEYRVAGSSPGLI